MKIFSVSSLFIFLIYAWSSKSLPASEKASPIIFSALSNDVTNFSPEEMQKWMAWIQFGAIRYLCRYIL